MKLFKKVMAIALASVLALSVLTGCGGKDGLGFSSSSLANTMEDIIAGWGTKITITADSSMDAQAKSLAEFAAEQTKDMTLTPEEIDNMLGQTATMKMLNQKFNIAPVSETNPMYFIGFVEISDKLTSNDTKNVYYAKELVGQMIPMNDPDGEWDAKEDGAKASLGTATAKIAGREYLVMLLKTSDVEKQPND